MRVKKLQRGYTAYLSDHEYAILQRMAERFNIDEEWKNMPGGQRRSWGRRIRHGSFLRVDEDTRKW
jgi:hypothetical protein